MVHSTLLVHSSPFYGTTPSSSSSPRHRSRSCTRCTPDGIVSICPRTQPRPRSASCNGRRDAATVRCRGRIWNASLRAFSEPRPPAQDPASTESTRCSRSSGSAARRAPLGRKPPGRLQSAPEPRRASSSKQTASCSRDEVFFLITSQSGRQPCAPGSHSRARCVPPRSLRVQVRSSGWGNFFHLLSLTGTGTHGLDSRFRQRASRSLLGTVATIRFPVALGIAARNVGAAAGGAHKASRVILLPKGS
jgi:hypothetical protein